MNQKLLSILRPLCVAALLIPLFPLSAQSFIFKNDIVGTNPSLFNPFTEGQQTDPNVTVTGIGRGTGLAAGTEAGGYSATGWNTPAVDPTAYFEFTITPNVGQLINYQRLEFNVGFSVAPNSAPVAVRSNLSDYNTNLPVSRVSLFTPIVVDLTALAYQQRTTTLTFRIYPFGSFNPSDRFTIYNFNFLGTTVARCNLGLPVGNQQQLFQPGNTLENLVVAGTNLLWYASEADALDGSPILNENTILVDGSTYYVTQSSAGCSSAPLGVTVLLNLAATEFGLSAVQSYPNPVTDLLHIEGAAAVERLTLYNTAGQILMVKTVNNRYSFIDFSIYESGLYFLKLQVNERSEILKVVKK